VGSINGIVRLLAQEAADAAAHGAESAGGEVAHGRLAATRTPPRFSQVGTFPAQRCAWRRSRVKKKTNNSVKAGLAEPGRGRRGL